MRKYMILIAVASLVALTACGAFAGHRVIGTDSGVDGPDAYSAYVDSIWWSSSNPAGAGYTTLNAPTGYRFKLIEIWSNKTLGAATTDETFTVRFWTSSTDSTSFNDDASSIVLQEKAAPLKFPVDCYKASFLSVGTSDSITARGYIKKD